MGGGWNVEQKFECFISELTDFLYVVRMYV